MIAFAFWDSSINAPPQQAELVSLWVRDCAAAGIRPRLLTSRDVLKSKQYRSALRKRGRAEKHTLAELLEIVKRRPHYVSLEKYRDRL